MKTSFFAAISMALVSVANAHEACPEYLERGRTMSHEEIKRCGGDEKLRCFDYETTCKQGDTTIGTYCAKYEFSLFHGGCKLETTCSDEFPNDCANGSCTADPGTICIG